MRPHLICIVLLSLGAAGAWAADIITCDFAQTLKSPLLQPTGDATGEGGVLRSSPRAGWQRSGLFVGPIPIAGVKWRIEYDVKPVAFGAQCQEFVSESPSTHWYMCYANLAGRLNLHTKAKDGWQRRGGSDTPLALGQWYHVTVDLAAMSIRYAIREREGGKPIWDSGEVVMDDLGRETVFGLVDEAPDTVGRTEWDNLKVATDDPQVAQQMAERARALEEQRRKAEARQAVARQLRQAGIALIPMPQEAKLRPDTGSFTLRAGMEVSGTDADTRAIAQRVLQERLGLKTVSVQNGGGVHLRRLNSADPLGKRSAQAYAIRVDKGGILLEARAPEGFFYAAQTLCQLAGAGGKCPGIEISDWPAIENRLVMIAVSQGAFQVIDVEYWKRVIRELAAVKINFIQPYFEGGTFYYEKYPFLGVKGRDGFTIEKGKLLSEYGKEHFVELCPQQESLGHSGNLLCHEELKDIRESGDVFCSSNPKTFQFLGDLYDELCQAFPYAHFIHVGGDEFAGGFAKCPLCAKRAAEIGKPGLYAEHMMKLREMLAQRHRKMMIWWHEEGYTDQAADKLAKDIAVFDWHYGNQASYPSLEHLQSEGFTETWATPAITRYYDATNDWDNTFGNVSGFLRAGAERKVPGECTCTWVHGVWGGRNLFELNLYGLVFSGECAWAPWAGDTADFRWKFGKHWFGLSGDDLDRQVLYAIHAPFGEGKEQGFWANNHIEEETLAAPVAKTAEEVKAHPEMVEQAKALLGFCERDQKILDAWKQQATRNQVTIDYLGHDVHIHATLARRILAVNSLLATYERAKALPAAERKAALAPEIDALQKLVADYREIETMFDRSVLEAGGGKCGWGGWFPFVAKGGVMFRAAEGRGEVEKEIAYLTKAMEAEALPEKSFVE